MQHIYTEHALHSGTPLGAWDTIVKKQTNSHLVWWGKQMLPD